MSNMKLCKSKESVLCGMNKNMDGTFQL